MRSNALDDELSVSDEFTSVVILDAYVLDTGVPYVVLREL